MSFAAINWSYQSPRVLSARLKPAQLAVLRALCWYYKDKGRTKFNRNCFVSVETLAETIGASTDTVNRAKAVLRSKGLISWDRSANFGDVRRSNSYRIDSPELDKILKANAESRNTTKPLDEDVASQLDFPPKPGFLYFRPDPEKLASEFSQPLNQNQANWLADALEFVCDSSMNRLKLYYAMKKVPDFERCVEALRRVRTTSENGRDITNRIGYLLEALKQESAPGEGCGG